jgi:sRNA-binding carbon storage regulator CsrA
MLCIQIADGDYAVIQTPAGETIKVCIQAIRSGSVRVGIAAPKTYIIKRRKLLEREREAA